MADRNLLRAFLHFVINAQMEGNPIVGEAWNAITQEAFDSSSEQQNHKKLDLKIANRS
jgi:hypothetical protein